MRTGRPSSGILPRRPIPPPPSRRPEPPRRDDGQIRPRSPPSRRLRYPSESIQRSSRRPSRAISSGSRKRVGQQGDALVGGDERDRELACVASPHRAELSLGPFDRQRLSAARRTGSARRRACPAPSRGSPAGSRSGPRALASSVSMRTNAFSRAFGVRWCSSDASLVLDLVGVCGDHRVDEVVLGLEVVVDVADGDIGGIGDIGERRALHPLRVERLTGAVDQPLALTAADGRPPPPASRLLAIKSVISLSLAQRAGQPDLVS